MQIPQSPFVLLDDQDGRRHAIRRNVIIALVEDPPGSVTVLLAGGRLIMLDQDLATALATIA